MKEKSLCKSSLLLILINKNNRNYQINITGAVQEDIRQRLQVAIQKRMATLDPNGIFTFSYATTAVAAGPGDDSGAGG